MARRAVRAERVLLSELVATFQPAIDSGMLLHFQRSSRGLSHHIFGQRNALLLGCGRVIVRCLTCQHLIVHDGIGLRFFNCGHDSMSELDSMSAAAEIVRAQLGGELMAKTEPDWCPIKRHEETPRQRGLFDE